MTLKAQAAELGGLTDGLQSLSLSAPKPEYLQFCPTGDMALYQLDEIPRYLFRVYTPNSRGSTDEHWTMSMDSRTSSAGSNIDIFARRDRVKVAGMINRHLRWKEGTNDNLVSWTSSLLFSLVYMFHLHANLRDGSPFDQIFLCVVDTTQFPRGVFLRDMDLVRAFRNFDYNLKLFERLRSKKHRPCSGSFYFGEYLSQGALKIEGKCRIVSARDVIDQGLYILRPELEEFASWKLEVRPPWAIPVVTLREVFYQSSATGQRRKTREEEMEAAIRIAERFGGAWMLPVAANLLALLPRRRDDPIILEEFRASAFLGERMKCAPSRTRVAVYDTLPEVHQFGEIMRDLYRDFCVAKMKEHLEVVERRLKRAELYILLMRDATSQEGGTSTNLSGNTEVNRLGTILDLARRLCQIIQGSEPTGATQKVLGPFTTSETIESRPQRGLNPFTDCM